jgi:hypothetical protein
VTDEMKDLEADATLALGYLIVRMKDGAEFQVTIVQSRLARD